MLHCRCSCNCSSCCFLILRATLDFGSLNVVAIAPSSNKEMAWGYWGIQASPSPYGWVNAPYVARTFFLQAFCSTVACPKYLPGFWMMVFEVLAWFPGRIATWMRSSIQSGSAAEIFAEIFVAPTSRLFEVVLALKSYGTFTPLLWVAGPSASKLCHPHK